MIRQLRCARCAPVLIPWLFLCWAGAATPPSLFSVDRTDSGDVGAPLPAQVLDYRYRPARWQTSICLPDDPQKSLVADDGTLLYDYVHREIDTFDTRVRAGLVGEGREDVVGQGIWDPRVPIVRTVKRLGGLELEEDAWAAAPRGRSVAEWGSRRTDYLRLRMHNPGDTAADGQLAVTFDLKRPLELSATRTSLVFKEDPQKRVFCSFWPPCEGLRANRDDSLRPLLDVAVERGWARPADPLASARFRDVIVGWRRPILFRYPCPPGRQFVVAFGFIEGYHDAGEMRPLELWVEGERYRNVDLVREFGRNQPALFTYRVRDNGDGLLELGVRSPRGATDQNTILSGLWIFPYDSTNAPDPAKILSGEADGRALAYVDADKIQRLNQVEVLFPKLHFEHGQEYAALFAFHCGPESLPQYLGDKDGGKELARAWQWWQKLNLPYDRMRVPDASAEALLISAVRNIYQARELRDGRPAFQVGPTCYRGLWAVDGAFITEAVAYLGRQKEVLSGVDLLTRGDEGPGGVAFSKKAGIRLWTLYRQAQLSGDAKWLESQWPKVVAEVNHIREYRAMSMKDDNPSNDGLMPKGFADGGLGGRHEEYTNVYWNLTGLAAAVEMAAAAGRPEATDWLGEYQDFWRAYDRARQRDRKVDSYGNSYVPVVLAGEPPQPPQRGAWAFMQAVFLNKIFFPDDPLMLSTMQMLDATQEEGLVYGTGWIADGIWNYAGSFYAHAHLALGHGQKAAATLYAFGNHASPLLCWREEQNLVGHPPDFCGDMPHNWASAEYIRLIRHLMILERGRDLHLLPGLPEAWTRPGMETVLSEIPTSFGPVSVDLKIAEDGGSATLKVRTPRRVAPERIVLHTEGFGGRAGEIRLGKRVLDSEALAVKPSQSLTLVVALKP